MKVTDEITKPISENIDLDKEISKLSNTNRRYKFKSETLKLTTVSLLLSMSTAVSLITILIPLGITNVNLGFALKYYIIAISFQVVGVYWGMIIGLLDGFLQFIIWGMSPLFRLTSAIGLALWVFLFWILNDKMFGIYSTENRFKRIIGLIISSAIILIVHPLISSGMNLVRVWIETGEQAYGIATFFTSWISLLIFNFFAVLLFATTTYRVQLIIEKIRH